MIAIATPTLIEEARTLVQHSGMRHVAIIMDGNRRWSRNRLLPGPAGHRFGADALHRLVNFVDKIGLKTLTVYAFSTENWKRGPQEVNLLMQLFSHVLERELDALCANQVRLRFIGQLNQLPLPLQRELNHAVEKTAHHTGLTLQVATNYGGRQELVAACQHLAQQVADGQLMPEAITEGHIANALSMSDEPDLLIRTGGESRISNFLLWQCAYSELWISPVLWPDFTPEHFTQALREYEQRERRYGR
jgi:undecaprenyl diphosphate synthase